MNDPQSIRISIPAGMLPQHKLVSIGHGIPGLPFGQGPSSPCEVVMAAPAMSQSPPCSNRADRRRVARASRKLGQQAGS